MTSNTVSKANAPAHTLKNQSLGASRVAKADQNYWAQGYVPSATAQGMMVAPSSLGSTSPAPAPAFNAPTFAGSDLLGQYASDLDSLANDCKIRGGKDIQHFKDAMNGLASASAKAEVAQPGQMPSEGQIKLSPDQIAAIKAAPNAEAAKKLVLQAISQQTGIPVDKLDPTHAGRKGNRAARECLNALLGTHIKDGREKNAGSAMTLDAICDSVAKQVQAMSVPTTGGTPGKDLGDGYRSPGTPGVPSEVMVSVGDYTGAAKDVAEMASPLIFDLSGTGLKIKTGELMEIDVDGDGKQEVITDLDKGIGLLVFDSKSGEAGAGVTAVASQLRGPGRGGQGSADAVPAGRDHFGDRTDLSGYGVVSARADRMWENGFDALRALCEHFELVREGKQYLDAKDLAFLEREVGLRMRIDGLRGEDRRFSDVKVTRINLGDAKKIQSMRDASSDAYGNKLMKQAGATFIVAGKTREYADIWFNVQARAKVAPPAPAKISMLAGMSRRI